MTTFKKRLLKQFGEHNPKEIEELNLDNFWTNKSSFTPEEKKGMEEYTNLIHLSLNNLGLKSLNNFPVIKNLYYLSIKNNELNGDDFDLIEKLYPKLKKLKISGNNIEQINNLSKLRKLNLRKIEVKENPFSVGNKSYRNKLFQILPSLEIIDLEDTFGKDVDTTDYYNEENEDNDDEEYHEENEEEDDENELNEEDDKDDEK